jgi:hypothetical protein
MNLRGRTDCFGGSGGRSLPVKIKSEIVSGCPNNARLYMEDREGFMARLGTEDRFVEPLRLIGQCKHLNPSI